METIRNTPLLVQVSIFYFVLQPILGINNPLWTGILSLAFYEGSFASEIMRAGINSVPRGQWEASTSVGLNRAKTYIYVVLPQATPLMLPPLAGMAFVVWSVWRARAKAARARLASATATTN